MGRFPEVETHIGATITDAIKAPACRELIAQMMARPGQALAPAGSAKWPTFVLETSGALSGDWKAAVPAAAAVEFAVAAIDVVDDLIDDEWEGPPDQRARALNASLALGWLAQRCASQLVILVGPVRARRVGNYLIQGSLASCAGQDLDLVLESRNDVSEDLAHEMTRQKSGSLVAMACQVGAAVATDDPVILEMVGRFGEHVGAVSQLLNDIAGIDPSSPNRRNDLQRRKKTLPIAYALHCARDEGLPTVLAWCDGDRSLSDEDEQRLAEMIHKLGALHYTWVVADAHRREALSVVEALYELTGRDEVRRLSTLVPALRPRERQ